MGIILVNKIFSSIIRRIYKDAVFDTMTVGETSPRKAAREGENRLI
jgi:hypothetical protein